MRNIKYTRGFTLIELLVLVVIVAILATIAVPNFGSMIKTDRQSAQINTLIAALNFARSEAIKRGGSVNTTICAGTTIACSGTSWSNGWVVVYTPAPSATSVLLQTYPPLSNGSTLTTSPTTNSVTFQSDGLSTLTTAPVIFKLCDSRGPSYARVLDVLGTGAAESAPTQGKNLDGTAITTCP